MANSAVATANRPVWVDLSSSDADASRAFYSKVFGWDIDVSPDPQYGGYGTAKSNGQNAAGIGPAQDPSAPTAWSFYIGTPDVEDLAKRVQGAGGKVVMPPFD